MCLRIKNVKLATRKPKNEIVTAYKVYTMNLDGTLRSPYRSIKCNSRLGSIIRSNRKSKHLTEVELQDSQVNQGIHCFSALEGARGDRGWNQEIYRVIGLRRDFVARGRFSSSRSIVFTKVKLGKKIQ